MMSVQLTGQWTHSQSGQRAGYVDTKTDVLTNLDNTSLGNTNSYTTSIPHFTATIEV